MRRILAAFAIVLASLGTAAASSVSVNIGINVPAYPVLQRVPGYPVYYAPRLHANYFFYDGMYWVFDGRDWWTSAWYDGPWQLVDPYDVPVYVLRVPVRYYLAAPVFFRGWYADSYPRWGEYWGSTWEQRRSGWNTYSLRSAPAIAPLPVYQRAYSGSRYPQLSEQVAIRSRSYSYQPRDTVARQQWQAFRSQAGTVTTREARVARDARVTRDAQIARDARVARTERVQRERIANAEARAQVRDRPAPPPQAQAKGWPGKGHEKQLEREAAAPRVAQERVAQGPPAHAQARGRQERDNEDDHPGRGRGHER